jgi:squalene synthase HpnC
MALIVGLNAALDRDLEDASPMTAAAPALQALDGVLAKAHSENFPVALWFLPKQLRADLLAIYGYARFVDDIGDEDTVETSVRLAMLDLVDADVTNLFAGGDASLPAVAALTAGLRAGRVSETPLRRLVEANRVDQHTDRYETFDELRHYCTLSADPVGHLVLAALRLATPDRVELSDKICTALQLAEHWQDVAEDLRRGRVYLPQEDLRRFGVSDDDLRAPHASPAVKTLMAFEVARARYLLGQGAPLIAMVPGRGKVAIAGFVAGGRAALHAITAADFDVLAGTPKPTKQRTLREAVGVLTSRADTDD